MPEVFTQYDRPDASYVLTSDQQPRDYDDSAWAARVQYERADDSELRILAELRREAAAPEQAAASAERRLLICNRKTLWLTVKPDVKGAKGQSRHYDSVPELMAALDRVKRHFGAAGVATRTWTPA